MENEMMNEVATEAVEEITTQVAEPSNNGWKNVAIVGGIMTLGALAWEFGAKPIGRWAWKTIGKARDKRKERHGERESDDIIDVDEEYPIR